MKNGISRHGMDGLDRLDPERRIALTYAAAKLRPALAALWSLDVALGAVVSAGSPAMIRQIKLAWWRDALAALDRAPAPPEPVLQQLQSLVLPRGLSGASLSEMADGWEHLLGEEQLSEEDLGAYARLRGGGLFAWSAMLLGGSRSEAVERTGEGWALIDLARHCSNAEDRKRAVDAARQRLAPCTKWPSALRPLGMLAALAWRDAASRAEDFERQGAPARMLRMLAHRATGR